MNNTRFHLHLRVAVTGALAMLVLYGAPRDLHRQAGKVLESLLATP